MAKLTDRLDFVVGKNSADLLEEHFGIVTVNDLLRHYPRKYSDEMITSGEGEELEEGEHVTFIDRVTKVDLRVTNRPPKREYMVVTIGNRKPKVTATFFNVKIIKKTLKEGQRVMLSGEVGYFKGTMQLTHPAFLVIHEDGRVAGTRSLTAIARAEGTADEGKLLSLFDRDFFPIYPANSKVQSWDIYACVRQVLDVLDPMEEPLPEAFLREHHLIGEDEALRAIHMAEKAAERDAAIARLTYDEAIGLQWALAQRRFGALSDAGPIAVPSDDGLVAAMRHQMPFELTEGQKDVLEVLTTELAASRPMNRMLQGEVGSGKTIVSVLAMLQMVDAGYQCALLAPTEVLAAQHARSIRDVLGPLAMAGQLGGAERATRIALLTGSMSPQQKKQVRDEVASGEAGIVIGTHALLQDTVEFHRLGMVVVDEQHRFGVEQRDRLRAKAPEGVTPHLLVMTATPIPRTVALTHYGDLETSVLRELPRGRQPITTNTIFLKEHPRWLDRAWQRIIEEVGAGRQAYIVASRIDADDDGKGRGKRRDQVKEQGPPAVTVVELFERLRRGPLSGLRLGLMHGRLSADEKDAVMAAFRAGDIDVLICTTVIEVGVDVPNATVMLVMDGDRFGISQLHQLRGRIGRGQHPSLCLLVTQLPEASKAGERLRAVASTLDGFTLADLDLMERREGDVLGYSQSGRPITLRFLSLFEHLDLILAARDFCDGHYATNPGDPGMASLAAPFSDTDRIEYLEKA
ncbi:ATP-dependent DNA helicase RecG [Mycobacterium sp. NPDC051804]|uniref:ATP-dependent DNA helicase RecG n=1 Tax=Mycobacterium sp. NPDC051804 TaxID=3364295 RepID=UPI0037ADE914